MPSRIRQCRKSAPHEQHPTRQCRKRQGISRTIPFSTTPIYNAVSRNVLGDIDEGHLTNPTRRPYSTGSDNFEERRVCHTPYSTMSKKGISSAVITSSICSICEVKYPGTGASPPELSFRIPSVPPVLITRTVGCRINNRRDSKFGTVFGNFFCFYGAGLVSGRKVGGLKPSERSPANAYG